LTNDHKPDLEKMLLGKWEGDKRCFIS